MTAPARQADGLEAIRREIDAIDDGLLKLIDARFAAVARVRALKAQAETQAASPMRPGREALILRRLVEADMPHVPADFCVRLWRAIIAAATLAQAPLRIHASAGLLNSARLSVLVRDHFGSSPLIGHPGEAMALEAVAANPGDVAVVMLDSPWLDAYLNRRAGRAAVIGCLPCLADGCRPQALILGHAAAEPTGADETLVVTHGRLPRDFAPMPLWQAKLDGRRLSSLPGFLSEHAMPLIGLQRSNESLGLALIGRYPSPIEVRS